MTTVPSTESDDNALYQQCIAAARREQATTEQRRQVYAERLAAESATWWRYVRGKYQERIEEILVLAGAAIDRGDAPSYQRYARRARRWAAILRRLNEMQPLERLRRFARVRYRPDAREILRGARWA